MSEEKKPETSGDVLAEYQRTCLAAGDLQYKIFAQQNDLLELNEKMLKLNHRFAELKAEEEKQAAAAAAAKPRVRKVR